MYISSDSFSASLTGLEGPIPSEVGNLPMLHTFIASQTDLNGTLPTELGNLLELSKPTILKVNHFEFNYDLLSAH